jgi:hypothetical protein
MGEYDQGRKEGSGLARKLSKTDQNKEKILHNLGLPRNKGLANKAIEGVVEYTTFMKYKREDADFKERVELVMEAMQELLLDRVEEKMIDAMLEGHKKENMLSRQTADLVKTYLKTKGKDRGYTEKSEIQNSGNDPIQINYVMPEPKQIENIEDQQIEENE